MTLGIIPARGGSKGIPRKNIKLLYGKPLIAWTIEAAQESSLLDRFVVSTEDREIAQVAKDYRAGVLIRPNELATDSSLIIYTLQDALAKIPADTVVLLQPTSPIRDAGLIDRCIRRFSEAKADCLATGFQCKFTEYASAPASRRQDIQGFFYDDGNIYVINAELIKKGKLFGGKIERLEISREENFEIDDELDFFIVEKIMERRLKNK